MRKSAKILFSTRGILERPADYRTTPHTLYKEVFSKNTTGPLNVRGTSALSFLAEIPLGTTFLFEDVSTDVHRDLVFMIGRSKFVGQEYNLSHIPHGSTTKLVGGDKIVVVRNCADLESFDIAVYTVENPFTVFSLWCAPGAGPLV